MDTAGAAIELTYSSRAPYMQWWNRIDPVNEIDWRDLVTARWSDVSAYGHQLVVDPAGYLTHELREYWSPIQRSDRSLYNYRSIMIMAMLHEWNQMTTFQIASVLGEGRKAIWNTLWDLYSAGMVTRLVPDWWDGTNTEESGSGSIWRIDRRSWVTQKWFDDLGDLDWALATNNSDPAISSIGANTPMALRHNLGTVEIVIKAMEACESVIGAWGEQHASSGMFYDASPYEMDAVRDNVGDGILITKSGKIIIIESSGASRVRKNTSVGKRLAEKAGAWVSACGKSDLDINVLFVEMSPTPNYAQFYNSVRIGVDKVSEKYVSSRAIRDKGKAKIFTVDARDWFPISRGVSESFKTLQVAHALTGELVDLAPEGIPLDTSSDIVVNTLASLHTPYWIRNTMGNHNE